MTDATHESSAPGPQPDPGAEEDRLKREEAETRNTADTLAWQTESLLKEQGDKVPADDREKIDVALKNLKETLAGSDVEAIKHAHELLLAASNDFTRRLYQNVQAQQTAGGATGGDPQLSDDEVADAEIVDDADDDQRSA